MATTEPYSERTKELARNCAVAFLETMHKCPCAVNQRKVEGLFLPLLEMFERDIDATGRIGLEFALDHIATYLVRLDEDWARGLHAANRPEERAVPRQGGGDHGGKH